MNDDGVYFNKWEHELIETTPEIEENRKLEGRYTEYLTHDEFNDWDYIGYETFEREYTTKSGETIHAFGYYGHD